MNGACTVDGMNYYMDVLRKYAVFTGRSRRSEYWYFVLFNVIISIALSFFGVVGNILGFIYGLAVFIPSIAVSIRRLHDTGRSGWWLFIVLIPLVGAIIFIVWLATDGTPGSNTYGPNPKEIITTSAVA